MADQRKQIGSLFATVKELDARVSTLEQTVGSEGRVLEAVGDVAHEQASEASEGDVHGGRHPTASPGCLGPRGSERFQE